MFAGYCTLWLQLRCSHMYHMLRHTLQQQTLGTFWTELCAASQHSELPQEAFVLSCCSQESGYLASIDM